MVPYLLVAPTALVVAAVLGYPLARLVWLSLQRYGLAELIRGSGLWVGLGNYVRIFTDPEFWTVLIRTVVFAAVNVGLTMVLGTLVALLLGQLGRTMRLLLTSVLVFVWATPWLVAVSLWQWLVDYEFGLLNALITDLGIADYTRHNWFADPVQGFAVITAVVVWGALPFVVITLHAAMGQVPVELHEAAQLDGAGRWARFWSVTWPQCRPIFVILTSLSIIWDFQVFNQVWVMLGERPGRDYYLISVYAFTESFKVNRYGLGAAIACVMVLVMLVAGFGYLRQLVRMGEVER